jgi:DNA adenine methylase
VPIWRQILTPQRVSKPFLRWAGSKRLLLPKLRDYWAPGYIRYIEPFMGSASLFFSIQPNQAILSDINSDLVETFIAVRDYPDKLYEKLKEISPGKEYYYEVRSMDTTKLGPIDIAARFIYLNKYCFNGLYRTNSKGHFNVPFSSYNTGQLPSLSNLLLCSNVLKNADIRCCDFEQLLLSEVQQHDFVYLDPPYVVANEKIFCQYGPHNFGSQDIERLKSVLEEIDRRGANFVLSYAFSIEILNSFAKWHLTKVITRRNISAFAKYRGYATEVIISNCSEVNLDS